MAASGDRRHPATRTEWIARHLGSNYGEQNGDLMRDPEMLFELGRRGDEIELTAYYWRNDYVEIEEYSAFEHEGDWLILPDLKGKH